MTECIPVEEMATLGQLPADDPRRRHAETCPRCSTLMFAYEEFVRAQDVAGADPRAAEIRLGQFIEAKVIAAPGHAARAAGAQRPLRGRAFGFRAWRTVAVAATVVIAAIAVLRWQPWAGHEVVYRGEPGAHFTGLATARAGDGGVDLSWNAVEGADSYRVTILAEDLTEITRLAPVSGVSARLDPGSIDASHRPWFWQVTALREGGELLASDPQRLP